MGAIPEADPDEPQETKPFKFVTGELSGYDARFPQQNQTKHCWQNYVDYYKCVNAKGEDFRPCRQFYHAFRSLCPKAWTDRWDTQREAGNFPARLE
ncbi:cytochrome c oxidase subunit VIb [Aspergillus fijiensis CBS 313.89]|uniref:Cytochrome c oxidase subunit 12, mitochondrial n=2 Tax=Aspergillus TaxID=5052 RepID=A0A8G1VVV4_9EURO|nr:cytochrome c oxidase, subunit VIb [Aspergillus japonicus CBS 114.51]XP_040798517.1 cytochrome c oxidase, subunit VIb [Aspergillus fijiensis CBS 313.89]RAH78340.1 cytochrome c oxidase, subunit VIb [Aspergillus japonicus CBS 114.51]RAK74507.1 cytochrome c oxidase, subunit VIb [Aspergillus fijiensis CBS 313.89]